MSLEKLERQRNETIAALTSLNLAKMEEQGTSIVVCITQSKGGGLYRSDTYAIGHSEGIEVALNVATQTAVQFNAKG